MEYQPKLRTISYFYQGDWVKGIKLADTLKLRIAARLENADNAKCKTIFQEVLKDATGAISGDDSQVKYMNISYSPFGNSTDIDYRSRRYATTSTMKFLKNSGDPRLPVYFEKNYLVGSYKDSLTKYNVTLPAFINPADPLIMYQGGPADWTTNPTVAAYIGSPYNIGPSTNYNLISAINRKFFSPKLNNATDNFLDVSVTYAETCFYIAEFMLPTLSTQRIWYDKSAPDFGKGQ